MSECKRKTTLFKKILRISSSVLETAKPDDFSVGISLPVVPFPDIVILSQLLLVDRGIELDV